MSETTDRTRRVPCPAVLVGEPWESMWSECQEQLREQGTWRITDAWQLQAMIELRRQAFEHRADVRDEPTVIGSTGQPVMNPQAGAADRAEALAAKLAAELMLPARARSSGHVDGAKGAGTDEPEDEFADLEDELEPRRQARGGKGRGKR